MAEKAKRILCGEGSGALLTVVVSGGTLVAAMLVIPAAMSRSAWLAILVGVAVVVAWQYDVLGRAREYFRKNRKKGFVLLALFVVLAGAAMAGIYNLKRGSAEVSLEGCGGGDGTAAGLWRRIGQFCRGVRRGPIRIFPPGC